MLSHCLHNSITVGINQLVSSEYLEWSIHPKHLHQSTWNLFPKEMLPLYFQ